MFRRFCGHLGFGGHIGFGDHLGLFREGSTDKITCYVPKYHCIKNGAFIRSVTIRVKYDINPPHHNSIVWSCITNATFVYIIYGVVAIESITDIEMKMTLTIMYIPCSCYIIDLE